MNIFEKYANVVDVKELAESQKEIEQASGTGERRQVPVGKYEVELAKLTCETSKAGNLMVVAWFRILQGSYAKSMIFYNGVIREDWMRHRVAKFLSDILDEGDSSAYINLLLKTNNRATINDFCMDVQEKVDGHCEYLLTYGENKGYNTYAIDEVYQVG